MTNTTTKVTGDQVLNMCKMQAAHLCKLIYRRPAGTNTFSTSFPKEIKHTAENWEEWKDFNFQNRCGLVQRLYKPKGYQPDAKNDEAMCWPALIHRGTDFDDFRGLGYAVSLHWPELGAALKNWKKRIDEKGAEESRAANERNRKRVEDKNFKYGDRFSLEVKIDALGDDTSAFQRFIYRLLPSFEFEDGYLFKVEEWLDVKEKDPEKLKELSQINWDDAEIRKHAEIKGQATGVFSNIGGNPTLDIKIVTRKEGPQGDWAANLLQGMGTIPDAYDLAMYNALKVATDYIEPTQDQRLMISGHSLGGGIAAAADCVFRYYANDKKMQNYTIVFNPAGIREETKERGKKIVEEGGDSSTANENSQGAKQSDGLIDIYHVDGEVLTTLAWRSHEIPFLLGAMNILKEKLPEPQGNRFSLTPIYPGKEYSQINNSLDKIPVFENNPYSSFYMEPRHIIPSRLFPINQYQDMYGRNSFEVILSLSNILNKYSVSGDGFSAVFGQFLNDIIIYFDNRFCGGSLSAILQNLNIDDEAVWNSIKKLISDNKWGAIGAKIGSSLYGNSMFGVIRSEVETLMRIMNWANEFHGMDYVIASLNVKLKEMERTAEEERQAAQQPAANTYTPGNREAETATQNFFFPPNI